MAPYLLAFAFIMITSNAIQKNKGQKSVKWLLAILIVGMSLFIGFRFYVGTDYASYYRTYFRYSRMSWGELIRVDDPALRIIAKLSSYLVDSPITMFTIAAFIFCTLFVTSIYKYTERFCYSMFLFVCSGTFLDAFNGVKQASAIAIIFFGLRFIKERQFVKYLITILIATLFHSTAILMILLYWLFDIKTTPFNIILIIIISIVLASSYEWLFSLVEAITGKNVNLEYTYYITQVNVFRIAVACVPCVLIFFLNKEDRLKNSTLCNMLIFNASLMCITSSSAFLARIGMYSTAYVCIAFVGLRDKITFEKDTKMLFDFVVIVAYLAYFIVSILKTANLYPYQLFF